MSVRNSSFVMLYFFSSFFCFILSVNAQERLKLFGFLYLFCRSGLDFLVFCLFWIFRPWIGILKQSELPVLFPAYSASVSRGCIISDEFSGWDGLSNSGYFLKFGLIPVCLNLTNAWINAKSYLLGNRLHNWRIKFFFVVRLKWKIWKKN